MIPLSQSQLRFQGEAIEEAERGAKEGLCDFRLVFSASPTWGVFGKSQMCHKSSTCCWFIIVVHSHPDQLVFRSSM